MLFRSMGDVALDVIAQLKEQINYGNDTASRISTHPDGQAANVATWITRTNNQAHLVARVGNDPVGFALISDLDKYGVQHKGLMNSGRPSGVVVILVDSNGERTMFPDNGANSGLKLNDLPELDGFNAVYISGYSPLDPASLEGIKAMITKIKAAGLTIYFDPASVGGMKEVDINEIKRWLPLMDVLLLNEEEAEYLTGHSDIEKALDQLLESSSTVVIKRGSHGATGKSRGGESVSVPAIASEVVDTMIPLLKEEFGNPSSSHSYGRQVKAILETSRRTIASKLNCSPAEINFFLVELRREIACHQKGDLIFQSYSFLYLEHVVYDHSFHHKLILLL